MRFPQDVGSISASEKSWQLTLSDIPEVKHIIEEKKILSLSFVSIAAGETLKFNESPTTYAAKKENVDHVLHFMAAQRIKMRQISSKGKKPACSPNYDW